MTERDKQAWLGGATDLEEVEVEVPALKSSVLVRSLSAGEMLAITDQCLTMKGDSMKVDSREMAVRKFHKGVKDPQFSREEANVIAERFGRSFDLVVGVIDRLSKADDAAVEKAAARFQA